MREIQEDATKAANVGAGDMITDVPSMVDKSDDVDITDQEEKKITALGSEEAAEKREAKDEGYNDERLKKKMKGDDKIQSGVGAHELGIASTDLGYCGPILELPGAEGSKTVDGSMLMEEEEEGKGAMVGGGRVHDFKFDYRGEISIMENPESCGRLLQQIPEAEDVYVGGEVDMNATYNEFAVSMFRLINIENRSMRGYEAMVARSKEESTRLGEHIIDLRCRNEMLTKQVADLSALGKDSDEERERHKTKESELSAKEVELEAVRGELGRSEARVMVLNEEVQRLDLELKKREGTTSEVDELRGRVARLESEAA